MKIKTKEALSEWLTASIKQQPQVRRYNKLKKHIEYFTVVSITPQETSAFEIREAVVTEPTFELLRISKWGSNEPNTRIYVDFYTLISAFDFVPVKI